MSALTLNDVAVAGRLAPQMGAHYLERHNGGRGVLMGGAPGVRILGKDPVTEAEVTVRDGRFGPYIQLGEGEMGGVWHRRAQALASEVVELVHQRRVAGVGVRGCHVLDPVPCPEAILVTEGAEAAFGGDSGAGQNNDIHAIPLCARHSVSTARIAALGRP